MHCDQMIAVSYNKEVSLYDSVFMYIVVYMESYEA